MASSEMDCAFLRFSMPKVASRSSVAMVMFSCAASSRNSPCSLRFSVKKPIPWSMAARGEWITTGSPSTSIIPPVALRTPKISCASSERPAPTSPARPTISPERTCRLQGCTLPPSVRWWTFRRGLPSGISRSLLNRSLSGRPTIIRTSSEALSLSRVRLPTYCPSRSTLTRSDNS